MDQPNKPKPEEALDTLFKATTFMKATVEEHNIFALCYNTLKETIGVGDKETDKKTKKIKNNGVENEKAII